MPQVIRSVVVSLAMCLAVISGSNLAAAEPDRPAAPTLAQAPAGSPEAGPATSLATSPGKTVPAGPGEAQPNGGAALRERLPKDTLAYMRLPDPWGLLTAPKDTMLREALENPQQRAYLEKLRTALNSNIIKELSAASPMLSLLLKDLNSPLEAVLLLPPDMPLPLASALITARTNFASPEELAAMLQQLPEKTPGTKIAQPLGPEGYATLVAGGLPVALHYDATTRALTVLTGATASEPLLRDTLQHLAPTPEHPMYTLENRVDAAHQGVFLWVDARRLAPLLQGMAQGEAGLQAGAAGLADIDAIAGGWGSRDGKARLNVLVEAPRAGFRQFVPVIHNEITLTSAGPPGTVLLLSAPLAQVLQVFEQTMASQDPAAFAEFQKQKSQVLEALGVPLDRVLRAFGDQLIVFTDEAGVFAALRIKDAAEAEQVLNAIVAKHGLKHEVREVDGKAYHHLATPSVLAGEQIPIDVASQRWLKRIKRHYYWTEDEGYWVFAQLPQGLLDRQHHGQRVGLQDWLRDTQRQDVTNSVLALSTRIDGTPRFMYYAYLEILSILGDLAGADLDLFGLPSAMDLKLPREGTYGFQIDAGESLLDVEFTFENNPLEFLTGLGAGALVGAGVAAAVAIPAYQDFEMRARFTQSFAALQSIKGPAEEYLKEQGRLPELKDLPSGGPTVQGAHLSLLDSGDGYAAQVEGVPGRLVIKLDRDKGAWMCTGENLAPKYVPAECK